MSTAKQFQEPHRRVSRKFWCPFCGEKQSKLLPLEQAEQFDNLIGPKVRDAEGRMPLQCWDCQQKEKKP